MDILHRIIANKKAEVVGSKSRVSQHDMEARAVDSSPPRGFLAALAEKADPVALIAEIKQASPSKGTISEDFDPVRVAHAYEDGGAACISVLTDEKFFKGPLGDLRKVHASVGIPLLRKDFVVDEYQIFESRAAGADCILLILAALDDAQLRDYETMARELGMDALVEAHNEREMERAGHARLIGINNRDLHTFETDVSTTERLAQYAPQDAFLVSESAIFEHRDVVRVANAGARGILVGEALMTAPDIGNAIKELLGR